MRTDRSYFANQPHKMVKAWRRRRLLKTAWIVDILLANCGCWVCVSSFLIQPPPPFSLSQHYAPSKTRRVTNEQSLDYQRLNTRKLNHFARSLARSSNGERHSDNGQSRGRNWIEKTTPSGTSVSGDGASSTSSGLVDEYSLGIDGNAFQLGPLTEKFHKALISSAQQRFAPNSVPEEILPVYKAYAMDLSAKEATKAALSNNGLQLIADADSLDKESGMPGVWGNVEDIQFVEPRTEAVKASVAFDSIQDAVNSNRWQPGMAFSFVVRNVRADLKSMDLKTMLQSFNLEHGWDDDENEEDDENGGSIEAAETQKNYIPIDVVSLKTLGQECENRCNALPTKAAAVGFAGGMGKGYNIVSQKNLGGEDSVTQIIDAMKLHGFLIVDLEENTEDEKTFANMWNATQLFFDIVNGPSPPAIPQMDTADGAGSRHAAVGFASYANGAMQFLETRTRRSDGTVLPEKIAEILGTDGINAMLRSQRVITNIGKDVIRLVLAKILRNLDAATQLVSDLIDDGMPVPMTSDKQNEDTAVNMSPHRMCRYSDDSSSRSASASEVFGAHSDTSFVTIVPVAHVSGLEVYDAAAGTWIRPELMARQHWEREKLEAGSSPLDLVGSGGRPWHCRYLIIAPGELLQLVTANTIPAAPHRVVTVTGGKARISAPILLRARSKARFDVAKYFPEGMRRSLLLKDAEGLVMEDIHDRLQPGGI